MLKKTLTTIAALLLCSAAFACTTAIVGAKASRTGRPLLWKQRDTGAKYNYVDFFDDPGTFKYSGIVNSADSLRESVWAGANEKGFSIMNSMSYGLSQIKDEDRPWEGVVMKKALQTCVSVADFENYIKNLPRPNGLEANFGVIDAEGNAAYFEVHDFGYKRFDVPEDGYLVRSNYSMTGRKGEGLGYERYDRAVSKMEAHGAPFDAEWIFKNLGRDELIARKTTVSCVVIEGPAKGEAASSTVMWVAPGYTPACYAIPVWVAAGDVIAEPLRAVGERYSPLNEYAVTMHMAGTDVSRWVAPAEKKEFEEGRRLDESFRAHGVDVEAVRKHSAAARRRFDRFLKQSILK